MKKVIQDDNLRISRNDQDVSPSDRGSVCSKDITKMVPFLVPIGVTIDYKIVTPPMLQDVSKTRAHQMFWNHQLLEHQPEVN